jgi:hypothetical protein
MIPQFQKVYDVDTAGAATELNRLQAFAGQQKQQPARQE